jgi:hypothetical protein
MNEICVSFDPDFIITIQEGQEVAEPAMKVKGLDFTQALTLQVTHPSFHEQ